MRPLQSSLARHMPREFDATAEKQRGWRKLGVLVVDVEKDPLSWDERALLRNIGTRLYGPRPDEQPKRTGRGHGGPEAGESS